MKRLGLLAALCLGPVLAHCGSRARLDLPQTKTSDGGAEAGDELDAGRRDAGAIRDAGSVRDAGSIPDGDATSDAEPPVDSGDADLVGPDVIPSVFEISQREYDRISERACAGAGYECERVTPNARCDVRCEFQLPLPPVGRRLDLGSLAFVLTASDGRVYRVRATASADCDHGYEVRDGTVRLCPDTCDHLQDLSIESSLVAIECID